MKKAAFLVATVLMVLMMAAFSNKEKDADKPIFIPPSEQRNGDAAKGYEYLTTGDFLKSGFPYNVFMMRARKTDNLLQRTGKNANVDYGYNVITTADSMDIVIPTCLQCHAEVFEGKLYVGLGNAGADFSNAKQQSKSLGMLKMLQATAPKDYAVVKSLLRSLQTVNPDMEAEVRGVNVADRLAALLVAHRDPQTLVWHDEPLLDIPTTVIPTDVPAWWLLKKKNAMFYNGFGRGDFAKFLMASNLLTVKDTAEASEVNSHFGDVLAYIKSIQPPKYPQAINQELADKGKTIFNNTCSRCHGTYGEGGKYPNLLIPADVIQTDTMLNKANQQNPQFVNWFNKSWFANPPYAARLEPNDGYVAPPLDGVWITAPYLHNGSVPTIEAVLNSKIRPAYWSRDFDKPEYDYEHLGWKYQQQTMADGKKVYNTTLSGYGNYGHYFGDKLSDAERKAVIEYLKTL